MRHLRKRIIHQTFLLLFALALTAGGIPRTYAHSPETTIKVVTFNVFAGKREMDLERLARQIPSVRALDADVIALQEVYDLRVKAAYREAFPDYDIIESGKLPVPTRWSYRALDWSHKGLEWVSKLTGLARWSKGSRHIFDGDTYGLMILVKKDRGTVLRDTQYSERYDIQAGRGILTLLEAVKPKAYLWIEAEIDGIPLLIVNTHLSNGVQNHRRAGQLAQLADGLESRRTHNNGIRKPTLFLADTNADAREPEIEWWHTFFRDTFSAIHPDENTAPRGGITWDEANPLAQTGNLREPSQRLDFVSVQDGDHFHFQVETSEVVFNTDGDYISDHNGVATKLKVASRCSSLLETLYSDD